MRNLSMNVPFPKERRRCERKTVSPQTSRAWLRVDERLFPAYITDISEDGLGMTIMRHPEIREGQTVRLEWLREKLESLPGTVRHLYSIELDHWHVGINLGKPIAPQLGLRVHTGGTNVNGERATSSKAASEETGGAG